MNKSQSMGMYVILAIVVLVFISTIFMTGPSTSTSEISYSNFLQKLQNKEFTKIEKYDDMIIAVPKEQPAAKTEKKATQKNTVSPFLTQETKNVQAPLFQYKVQIPVNDTELMDKLNNSDADITVKKTAETNQLAGNIGTFVIILFAIISLGLMIKAIQAGGSQAMSFGKSKAKMLLDSKVKTTFKDVAGIDEEKKELEEIVDFLKNGEKYMKLGAKIPKGVLLVGPPGTGKTLMAKAVAGEASVPFFSISGSDFVEMFVGVGASRVRDMFKKAKETAPCIIFIDEIDAVGRQRGAGFGGGHDEREQTLNQLLVEMDGMEENTGIVVVAATNRPDVLDPALLRAGRFDRQITVSLPDRKGREAILRVHARNKHISEEVDLGALAKRTPGFSGADLENVLNESAILAVRHNEESISMADVDEAIDRVMMGPAKVSRTYDDKTKKLVAYHESGHAIVGLFLDNAQVVQKVTIIPRGQAGGYNLMTPKEEKMMDTKNDLLATITSYMGGRVAEETFFDDVTTGASNDIERATNIAKDMVTLYGMSDLGPIKYNSASQNVFLGRDYNSPNNVSGQVAFEIDQEVRKIVNLCHDKATEIIGSHKQELVRIAEALMEYETLTSEQIQRVVNGEDISADFETKSAGKPAEEATQNA